MKKTLLIKEGTLGGLVRITPLLRALKGDISWLTLFERHANIAGASCGAHYSIAEFKEHPKDQI